MMLENFINRVNGQVVSSDNIPLNAGQSVQLIAEWCKSIGLPFQWSLPAYWWDEGDDTFLEHWEKVSISARADGFEPKPGDIVIFGSTLPGTGNDGHASIYLRLTGDNSWEGFDSNWGGKSAHKQSHTWSYVLGWFTPRNKSVLESPVATAIAESSPYAPYDTEMIGAKIVTARNQPTVLYNLTDVSYESMIQNPLGYVPMGFEITVTAIAHHHLGGNYYMPDSQKAEGYLVEDCQEYEEEPVEVLSEEVAAKTLYVPNSVFPPLRAPNMSDTLTVPHKIPYYISMSDAAIGRNPHGTLTPTQYYVYKRSPNGMLSLTSHAGQSMRTWINPKDLEVKDEETITVRIEEKKPTFDWDKSFVGFQKPRWYVATRNDTVVDFEDYHSPILIKEGQSISLSGYLVRDGVTYGIPSVTYEADQRYAVPLDSLRRRVVEQPAQPVEVTHNAQYTGIYDHSQVNVSDLPFFVKLILRAREIFK